MRLEAGTVMTSAIEYLSYSKIDKFLDCPLKFKFKYVDKIPEKAAGIPLSGNAVHSALEHALIFVKAGKPLPPAAELDDVYLKEWDAKIAEEEAKDRFIGWDWREPKEKLKAECRELVKFARNAVLPSIHPKLIEEEINFNVPTKIGPVRVNGYIDLVTEENEIVDWKTSDEVKKSHRKMGYQMPCYSVWAVENGIGLPGGVTKTKKIVLIRGEEPSSAVLRFDVHPAHRERFKYIAANVWMAIQAGAYVPNNASFLCSEKWCPYWAGCEGELQ